MLTCTKSVRKPSGRAYWGSLPKRATASQLRSTAQDSMCTKLCSIACLEARLPPLPSPGILPGATTLTYSSAQSLGDIFRQVLLKQQYHEAQCIRHRLLPKSQIVTLCHTLLSSLPGLSGSGPESVLPVTSCCCFHSFVTVCVCSAFF